MEMETETIETKKCNNCLRRVTIEQGRCPFCRKGEFTYDGAVIERVIPRKFNFFEGVAAMFKKP